MTDAHTIELFILKCSVIQLELSNQLLENDGGSAQLGDEFLGDRLEPYIKQFEFENRRNASRMSAYYRIFYMLENDIRRLISETMEASHGADWWHTHAPQSAREEAKKNREREEKAAITLRSDDEIDYITFGQLSEIIKDNWSDFAGMLSNQSAVMRVLSGLNMLRGTIAHCGVLAEDEVDRLKLAIRDWFRVLEGPKS
jgi:hypothetical protein